ncbi:MAG: PilW family protein [Thiobacillus sp.]
MKTKMTPISTRSAITHRVPPKRQEGLTLVEIMIALTLGLIVLLAIGSIYIGSRQTYRVQEDNARLQEAGRYALEVVGRSIRQAGSDTEMTFNPVAVTTTCGTAAPCNTIAGTNNASPTPDIMTVQLYAGRDELSGGVWNTRDCTGGLVPSGTVITNAFDVTGGNLRCTGSQGGVQTLISDVEDFQVVYGIDTTGDQSADRYVAAPGNWAQVVTARVCVLVRSANNGLTAAPQRFLNCAGALGTADATVAGVGGGLSDAGAGDLRLRRSFVATYNLRNRVNATP